MRKAIVILYGEVDDNYRLTEEGRTKIASLIGVLRGKLTGLRALLLFAPSPRVPPTVDLLQRGLDISVSEPWRNLWFWDSDPILARDLLSLAKSRCAECGLDFVIIVTIGGGAEAMAWACCERANVTDFDEFVFSCYGSAIIADFERKNIERFP